MSTLPLSLRARGLRPSPTLAITARAKQLRAEGQTICVLSAGEPDFDTPAFIRRAASEAMERGATRYGPAAGEPPLRQAIARKLSEENGIATEPAQVLVTNGGKQALFNLFQVLLDPGEEVLLPAPYWVSYPEMVRLAGGSVRLLPCEPGNGFLLEPEQLEAAIGPSTRALVINSPGNPTGTVLGRERLEAIAEVLRRHPRVVLICDEIYEHLLAEGERHHSLLALAPDLQERGFLVNGFAKSWAMTGWRIGYLSGPAHAIAASVALQSQSTSNVCTFAQYGALAALQGGREEMAAMVAAYNERRDLLSSGLQAIPGVSLQPPRGAFYAFPDISGFALSSLEFSRRLLEEQGLAVVPGEAFGDDRCIRLSCAAEPSAIRDGLERLGRFIDSLRNGALQAAAPSAMVSGMSSTRPSPQP
ncbi:pyridoxal phosphate-dependent aminotransferase [Synechococcus sp. RSCCF101]|uniref:pyridoxal phosphate-dependent aminotransferase n=1 Tax=Synechococcus sp. RSCCF101 TaxID=2511069 RepID=UPI001248784E|nr:pyridoxal phosphate-dependent aminotransferase [Synechococcus sp. RSCCF101]QEY31834.1 pyridoxal phosphate-dependent aminotransferase [Synechococcus sp. RSCCF101]